MNAIGEAVVCMPQVLAHDIYLLRTQQSVVAAMICCLFSVMPSRCLSSCPSGVCSLPSSLRSSAVTALIRAVALGILAKPVSVYESFFNALFRGLLTVLMIIMGMEAAHRMNA
ncbi:MAG: hypothetical protein RLZZ336_1227 [Cyanobacteriota bacterium]